LDFDILLVNGRVVDGSGNPWFRADLGITGDSIDSIGKLNGSGAKRTIDAEGLVVSPGFIDIHGHSSYSVLIDPRVESKVRQGVTTEVSGNCGTSPAPMNRAVREYRQRFMRAQLPKGFDLNWETMREYLVRIDKRGAAFNVVPLVGQGSVRQNVMGFEDRQPTKGEMEEMRILMAGALKDGAWGMSSGLVTTPSCYADTDELTELAKVVAEHHGVYYIHLRGEGETLFKALDEAFEIGKRSGVALEIVHFKASGRDNWGNTDEGLRRIKEARAQGLDITLDQYPYTASSIGLSALIPPWAHEGGNERLLERLGDPKFRRRIKEGPARLTKDLNNVMISFARNNPGYEGMRVTEIARIEDKDPMDTVFDLLLAENAQTGMVAFGMSEEDVERVMRSPYMMVCSDGLGVSPSGVYNRGKPHPRYYGAFPRVLSRYVREKGVLSLQEAIRKMTSLPAQRIGLRDRGLLREGFKADIVLFDPETVNDEATFTDPHRFPKGIYYVMVNGGVVVDGGDQTGEYPGKVLRKPS
jgi:N-acyl-D-aspartate/D-glutamate deacylase